MVKPHRLPRSGHSAQAEPEIKAPRVRTRFYAFLSYRHKGKEPADRLQREHVKVRLPQTLAGKLMANGVVPSITSLGSTK